MYDPILKASTIASTKRVLPHPVNSAYQRTTTSLGDAVGLKSVGVHHCLLAPHTQSSTVHWHEVDEEWLYILRGKGKLVLYDAHTSTETEREVGPGDFIGCRNGKEGKATAHALRATDEPMEYLCGGTREDNKFLWINRKSGDMKWGNADLLSDKSPASA
ncbi:hypothetical protein BD626DRAFT_390638 [Schizophyllum amplum]|uniref:Cupin type-2 domain-containing protein n=1 Tax=Schizophyllum amplum TaxID=97359 RepID=A0A550CY20_9AGAR|nr:hypothetical protein BD626DRAFT_390638 [Auriculariopsis ampla]